VNQEISQPSEQLGDFPEEISKIQRISQQLFDGMNKLNSEAKKYTRKKQRRWKCGSK